MKVIRLLPVILFGLLVFGSAAVQAAGVEDVPLDQAVMDTLQQCQKISTSCADTTSAATGVLVFPNVLKADIIFGAAGGKGALIENGAITGYYNIGAATAGLQFGLQASSHVYVFRTADALAKLKSGEWQAGTSADITVVEADAGQRTATGDVLAYVFDGKGLHAGVSADVFKIWKTEDSRF